MTTFPQNPGLRELVQEGVRSRLATTHTSAPGSVLSYDRQTQTCTVQLVVRGRRIDPRTKKSSTYIHRPIVNVPIEFPGGTTGGMTFPIVKGDPVAVRFFERDFSQWLLSGEVDSLPVDPRRHSLNDAVAGPCVFPLAGVQRPDDATADGATVIYGDDIRWGGAGAVDLIALAPLVAAELLKSTQWQAGMKLAFDLHTHGGVTTGPGFSATPVATAPAPVDYTEPASSKVRSE